MASRRLMVHAAVGRGQIIFSSTVELRCPRIFGRWTAMSSVFVAVVNGLRMMHVDLSRGGNRYETGAQVNGIVLQLGLVLLDGRRWI